MDGHRRGLAVPFESDTRRWYAEFAWERGENDLVVDLLRPLVSTGPGDDVDHADLEHLVGTTDAYAHALARLGRVEEAFAVLSQLYRASRRSTRKRHEEGLLRRLDAKERPTTPPDGAREVSMTPDGERIVELERTIVGLRARAERMERAAHTDALTGIHNRRGFERAYATALADVRRTDGELTLALLDLDEFKRVNDTFGHDVGDRVLAQVASVLVRTAGVGATVARWGGEEFALAFPGVALDEAERFLDTVRQAVERHAWHRLDPDLRITCSIGVVAWNETTVTDTPLSIADRRLYAAKRAGRNRTVARDEPLDD